MGFLRNLKDSRHSAVLKIPSDNKHIRKISGRILSALAPHGVSEEKTFDIKLCVEEAVRNAIVHGNRSQKHRTVTAAWRIDGDRITIEVEDEGEGFDPAALPDPTDPDYIMRNSGRGVYLIRKLMDSVAFSERGKKITMVKKFK